MGCGCDETESGFSSEWKYDGEKLVCGSNVIKPCTGGSDVIKTLFTMACRAPVFYTTTRTVAAAPISPAAALTATSYTIPAGGAGTYEIEYTCVVSLPGAAAPPYSEFQVQGRKNTVVIDADTLAIGYSNADSGVNVVMTLHYIVSQVSASEGDVLAVYGLSTGGALANYGVCKITKIG